MRRPLSLVYLGLAYVVFCWALNVVLVKHLIAHVDPLAFTGARFVLMTPLAALLARVRGESFHVSRRDLPLLIACGACGYGVYQYAWILGLSHTTPFAAALLGSLTPIMTLGIVATLGQERVRSGRWLAAVIALFGVAVFEGAFSGRFAFRLGDALSFGAAATFALYNVLSARLLDRYSPLSLLTITMAIGTLMILPGAVPRMFHVSLAHVTPGDWAIATYALLFPVLLTFPVWSYGITRLGAGRTSLFQFALPILAGVLSVLILGLHFTSYELLGGAICIAGMVLAQLLGRVSLTELWTERTLPMKR